MRTLEGCGPGRRMHEAGGSLASSAAHDHSAVAAGVNGITNHINCKTMRRSAASWDNRKGCPRTAPCGSTNHASAGGSSPAMRVRRGTSFPIVTYSDYPADEVGHKNVESGLCTLFG
jgi:hypothetical protein